MWNYLIYLNYLHSLKQLPTRTHVTQKFHSSIKVQWIGLNSYFFFASYIIIIILVLADIYEIFVAIKRHIIDVWASLCYKVKWLNQRSKMLNAMDNLFQCFFFLRKELCSVWHWLFNFWWKHLLNSHTAFWSKFVSVRLVRLL